MVRMAKTERVLVWGARGFIGRHLVHALLARGYEVAVQWPDPDDRPFLDRKRLTYEGFLLTRR